MKKINDHEYWNDRYTTGDWEKYGGDQQAEYFAELAMNAFPEWLIREMHKEALSVRDYGCARGSGTALLAKNFPTCTFTGVDFSEDAIDYAKEHFSFCDFETGDLYTMELPPCDMVFSSNTLEHLRQPKNILYKLVESAQKYAVLLLPLDDATDHYEHFFKFSVDFFPAVIGQMTLCYFDIIDCRDGKSPYWNGKQILLVYVHQEYQHLSENMVGEISKKNILPRMDQILQLQENLNQLNHQFEAIKTNHQNELEKIKNDNDNQLNAIVEKHNLETKTIQEKAAQEKQQVLLESEEAKKESTHALRELQEKHDQLLEKLKQTQSHIEETLERVTLEKQQILLESEKAKKESAHALRELQQKHDQLLEKLKRTQSHIEETQEKATLERQQILLESEKAKKESAHALRELQQKNDQLLEQVNQAQALIDHIQEKSALEKQQVLLESEEAKKASANKAHELQQKHDQLLEQLKQAQANIGQNEQVIQQLNSRISQIHMLTSSVINTSKQLSGNRSFKFAHFLSRWRVQYQQGNKSDRKAFVSWLHSHLKGKSSFDSTFNPLYQIIDPLKKIQSMAYGQTVSPVLPTLSNTESTSTYTYPASFHTETYQKYDVIVFAVIDYDFRYQRPQQIADHFVREGHRVFYVNSNFNQSGNANVIPKGNLFQVSLSSSNHNAIYSLNEPNDCKEIYNQLDHLMIEYGIRDALMIADYPTWIDSISCLKERYGFSLVTDYMDDFTGFLSTTEPFVKDSCLRLLTLSDTVVASSEFLVNVAKQYNRNVFPIRNGTEFKHFHSVFGKEKQKVRKVIGYYGAIAEWFDFSKIEYLAKRFTDCDIVLIGDITNEKVKACHLPNVKKLGEKPYRDLPQLLADFDVCLIPFDTSTDLIKATNPVKFYEYLSAGKKIVASEIPELEPFRNQYVYLANKNKAFGDYVELCLTGRDTLASAEECAAFAQENDWSQRVKAFEKAATQTFPRVSVIVLCYNQLDYTRQCVESILKYTAYPNYELVLVDNNSTDDTAAYLKEMEKHPQIKIVLNKTNRGFAGGNNDGIDVASGDYIVLLNNDTLVTRGWMTNMVKHCRSNKKVGIVGAVTNSIGNEAQIPVEYADIKDMPAFAYGYTAAHMNETYPHDGVLAMYCVMFSRQLVNEIGKLDENYGIGMFEDDDYSVAASRAGYQLVLPEDVFIHHFGSVSFKKLEDEKHRKLFEQNKAYFEQKWKTKWHMHHYRK